LKVISFKSKTKYVNFGVLKGVCRPGVWETTLFSLSSQIYGHLCV
jgi:hypothetical protein